MPIAINGRLVYLCQKARSQTVNICTASNRRGEYDWIVRLFQPIRIADEEVVLQASPTELVRWLVNEKAGQVEKEPPSDDLPPPAVLDDSEDEWLLNAVHAVDAGIDQLVSEFVRAPYLHRVEHSLHARLFSILARCPIFTIEVPLLQHDVVTQPLHKEWPETIPEVEKRRGNFDLAVLSPRLLSQCNIQDFCRGGIAASIAIEVGLDYGVAHFEADRDKLINSKLRHGYLIHFSRNRHSSLPEDYVARSGNAEIKVAYASVLPEAAPRFKLVNEGEVKGVL